ncbi:MAG: hypothetical protein IKO36_06750 [Bacteroidaceae bacterium]|nr:hypothetical protein [Bacteroidaceae bacterium]
MAAAEYKKWVESHTWDLQKVLTFSLSFIEQFIKGDVETVLDNPPAEAETPSSKEDTTGLPDEMSKAYKESAEKMKKWHEGTRNQNVGAMGDGKLKLSYKVCVDKGFEKEAAILKAEANKRGLVLESFFTIEEYIELI